MKIARATLLSPNDPKRARSAKQSRLRNRLYEKREAAAIANNARIQVCARSPQKHPTSKFMLRNTQGTQIYITNDGPGHCGNPGLLKLWLLKQGLSRLTCISPQSAVLSIHDIVGCSNPTDPPILSLTWNLTRPGWRGTIFLLEGPSGGFHADEQAGPPFWFVFILTSD